MIPNFDSEGNLPPGVHTCTWQELVARFGQTPYRRWLIQGLLAALRALSVAGCTLAYIDGSFVTVKEQPGDFDACWDMAGVDPTRLDPVLLNFDQGRLAC